jgi:hypothetical protein
MDAYLTGGPLEANSVVDLLQAYPFKELQDRILWVDAFFDTEDRCHDYIGYLVRELYSMGYYVYAGNLIMTGLGRSPSEKQVYLWGRMNELHRGYSSDEIRLSLSHGIILQADSILLITQAIAILNAYKAGFDARSGEIRTALSGLMGVDIRELVDDG